MWRQIWWFLYKHIALRIHEFIPWFKLVAANEFSGWSVTIGFYFMEFPTFGQVVYNQYLLDVITLQFNVFYLSEILRCILVHKQVKLWTKNIKTD